MKGSILDCNALITQVMFHFLLVYTPQVPDSPYYQILKEQHNNLDFLMPQFYNGITKAHTDGFDGVGRAQTKTSTLYNDLVNDMFDGKAEKVVFGFCISDCSGQGSNVNADQAVDGKYLHNSNVGMYAVRCDS